MLFKKVIKSMICNIAIKVIELYNDILLKNIKESFGDKEVPLTSHNLEVILEKNKTETIAKLEKNL